MKKLISRKSVLVIILPLLLLLTGSGVSAQVKDYQIIGRWKPSKVIMNRQVVFDKTDSLVAIQFAIANRKQRKPEFTAEDSTAFVQDFKKKISSFTTQFFIEFLKNGTYKNSEIKSNTISGNEEEGIYRIEEGDNKLIMVDHKEKTSECKLDFQNDQLILIYVNGNQEMTLYLESND